MKNFILIGAAGYVAPRHLKAIKDTGNNLLAVTDPHDSVGILDRYFPDCKYFKEFERLDRYVDKVKREGTGIDYVSVCSPNYLHDAHVRWALRIGADAICEKPLVLNERNLDGLKVVEEETGKRVWTILQLRLHQNAIEARTKYTGNHKVEITYAAPRGQWYQYSWKGDESKSGGLATNIGIHLFDMATWLFGPVTEIKPSGLDFGPYTCSGGLKTKRADIEWFLSVSGSKKRQFTIDGDLIDFTDGFDQLHTDAYEQILNNMGFGIEETREAIMICESLR